MQALRSHMQALRSCMQALRSHMQALRSHMQALRSCMQALRLHMQALRSHTQALRLQSQALKLSRQGLRLRRPEPESRLTRKSQRASVTTSRWLKPDLWYDLKRLWHAAEKGIAIHQTTRSHTNKAHLYAVISCPVQCDLVDRPHS